MKNETLLSANIAVWGIILVLALINTTGCIPLVTGIKEYKTSGGTTVSFITGADFKVGANGVDSVDDNRGIKPNGAPLRAQTVKTYN